MNNLRFLCQSALLFFLIFTSIQADGILRDAGNTAQNAADSVVDTVGGAANAVKEGAKSGYNSVANAAEDTADAAHHGYHEGRNAAGEKVGQARNYASDKMHEGAYAIDNGVQGALSIAFCVLPLFIVHYFTC